MTLKSLILNGVLVFRLPGLAGGMAAAPWVNHIMIGKKPKNTPFTSSK